MTEGTAYSFTIEKTLAGNLPENVQNEIKRVADNLPELEPNVVNATGVHKEVSPEGDLHILFLVRNGTEGSIDIRNLALEIGSQAGVISRVTAAFEDSEIATRTNKLFALAIASTHVDLANHQDDWYIRLFKAE